MQVVFSIAINNSTRIVIYTDVALADRDRCPLAHLPVGRRELEFANEAAGRQSGTDEDTGTFAERLKPK